ncbi:flagellar motor switch protein FliG [Planctomycetales bacterium]|nr:flagellar motor switch protein FliG [Planctomycetales bacterium]GHT08324.1 flagellar motor switch protein FliG [Planctomycetales bacterium]GHV18708.1 flagellar motor switch protein FliG [Planctomycetales bacterium]
MAAPADDAKPASTSGLSGLRKAAILMIALDPESSSKIMSNLSTGEIETISMEIAKLDQEIKTDVRDGVVKEYYQTYMASKYLEQGGMEYARMLLEKSLSPEAAARILSDLEQSIQQTPFHFLKSANSADLLRFIIDEHPQTISLIMAHLSPKQSSEILAGLSPKKQIEVVKRIARMDQTTPEAIREVEKGLEERLSSIVNQDLEKAGGVENIAEVLNLVDRTTEKTILEQLEEDDPEMVEQIRRLMFVFEDLIQVNDKGIQATLKEIENDELALALKTASEELQAKIFKNMSERAAAMIRENMEFMGPTRLSDVEAAQQRIVDVVRRLEESGEVIVAGRGGDAETVV